MNESHKTPVELLPALEMRARKLLAVAKAGQFHTSEQDRYFVELFLAGEYGHNRKELEDLNNILRTWTERATPMHWSAACLLLLVPFTFLLIVAVYSPTGVASDISTVWKALIGLALISTYAVTAVIAAPHVCDEDN